MKNKKEETVVLGEQSPKPKKIPTKKQLRIRFWSITALIVVVAVFLGQFVGNWIVNSYLNIFTFAGDESTLMETESTIKKWKNKSIDNMTPVEAFVVAQYNLENSENYLMVIDGEILATLGVTVSQSVYSYNYRIGDDYYNEYISKSSMVEVATGYKYNKKENVVHTFKGGAVDKTTAVWKEYLDLTYDEYKEKCGIYVGQTIDYIVSRQTVNQDKCTALEKQANGNYKFSLSLNSYATVNYTKKMDFVAGTKAGQFYDIVLNVEVDENLNFVTVNIVEEYTVPKFNATAKANMTQTYDFVSKPIVR